MSDNPFVIPSDEDVFTLRQKEKEQRRLKRLENKKLKIWEKTHGGDHKHVSLIKDIRRTNNQLQTRKSPKKKITHAARLKQESMTEYIAKKRDMFLTQMSLDTKREEIRKLEEKARMKEEALTKSEQMLEEDAMRFDSFLKENDRKAHEALKRADRETRFKQDKAHEIKRLSKEISKVEAEIGKYEERLKAGHQYKIFLDSLVPQEHWTRIIEARKIRGDKNVSLEYVKENLEKNEMYFQSPQQLLDIFARLEERNLFLIQNVQETEEALEELKQKYEETKEIMEEKTNILASNIGELKSKSEVEHSKAQTLNQRTKANVTAVEQEKLLAQLANKVSEVYNKAKLDASDLGTLDMLRGIERKLETLLKTLSHMSPELREKGEKEKEDQRREKVRRAKYKEQQRLIDERLAKSNARAQLEIKLPVGKKLMYRSPPIQKKKVDQDLDAQNKKKTEDEELYRKFFT